MVLNLCQSISVCCSTISCNDFNTNARFENCHLTKCKRVLLLMIPSIQIVLRNVLNYTHWKQYGAYTARTVSESTFICAKLDIGILNIVRGLILFASFFSFLFLDSALGVCRERVPPPDSSELILDKPLTSIGGNYCLDFTRKRKYLQVEWLKMDTKRIWNPVHLVS